MEQETIVRRLPLSIICGQPRSDPRLKLQTMISTGSGEMIGRGLYKGQRLEKDI